MWPFKKKESILFNFNINRRTGDDEQVSVTFNGFKGESKSVISDRLFMIGEILQSRMVYNNQLVLEGNKKVKDAMKPKKEEGADN